MHPSNNIATRSVLLAPNVILRETKMSRTEKKELSLEAKHLLECIASRSWKYVRWHTGASLWVLFPDEESPLDPRVEWPEITHPECLRELLDSSYLEELVKEESYHLTEEGQEAGEKIREEIFSA